MAVTDPRFAWMEEPRLRRIIGVLNRDGEARFVGGCVRDSLLGLSPLEHDAIDIDIATDRTPQEMKTLFDAVGIRWLATGEDHGTLTAIEGGLSAECTTLRADVETDGRHAEVRFTRNWDEDWRRRDFTINALYANESGDVIDPVGGLSDLAAGIVHFIGNPADRIREDALRILRFFRFSARFAASFDAAGLAAIATHTELLDILSRERVWSELRRIFTAARAPEALAAAHEVGVLGRLLAGTPRLDIFAALHARGLTDADISVLALWPGLDRAALKARLKPSNDLLDAYEAIKGARDLVAAGAEAPELLYRFGRDHAAKGAALWAAEGHGLAVDLEKALSTGKIPVLPFTGKDLISRGIEPGPEVSQRLAMFEALWLKAGAPESVEHRDALLQDALGSQPPR